MWLKCLSVALLLAVPRVFAEPVTSGTGEFAVSFDVVEKRCARSGSGQCVLGKLPSKQPLFLLGSQDSTTCLARAKTSFESQWDSGSFPLTYVDTTPCPKFRFKLAVKAKTDLPYRLLKPESLPSPTSEVQREIETSIRRAAPKINPSGPEHLLALSAARPLIFRFPSMDRDTYIAVFESSETPGDQAHFLYARGNVKLIHSAASISSVFSLGNRHFIHYTFTCRVGCGYGGDFVVQFPEAGFRVEMFDASGST